MIGKHLQIQCLMGGKPKRENTKYGLRKKEGKGNLEKTKKMMKDPYFKNKKYRKCKSKNKYTGSQESLQTWLTEPYPVTTICSHAILTMMDIL